MAAKKFFRRPRKGLRYVPRVLVTDKHASYGPAHRVVMPSVEHRQSKYLNIHTEFAGPGHHLGNLTGAARVLTSGVLSVWAAGYRTLGRAPC